MKKNLRALVLGTIFSCAALNALAVGMVGLTTNNEIFTMANAASPGMTSTPTTVTGVSSGQVLVGIDYNPADGKLYALGYASSTGQAQLYTINIASNTATTVGSGINLSLGNGQSIGFDFNPMVHNHISVAATNGNFYTLNAVTGTIINSGTNIGYAPGDINSLFTANIGATAYTNSFFGADATRQIGYDMNNNVVVLFDAAGNGQVHTVGSSGLLLNSSTGVGLDAYYNETTHSNTTYLVAQGMLSSGSNLYTIDETTGFALMIGAIGNGNLNVRDIAVEISRNVPPTISGRLMVGLTLNSRDLVLFDSDQPNIIRDRIKISGVTSGQTIVAIDYRPANMQLYALGYDTNTTQYQLYTINTSTGVATAVSSTATLNLGNGKVSFDFNPVTDQIHIMGSNGLNVILNGSTGAIVATNNAPQWATGDVNVGVNANVAAVAHTNNYHGATSTQAYGLDLTSGSIVNVVAGGNTTLQTLLNLSGILSNNGGTANNGSIDYYYDHTAVANEAYIITNTKGDDNGVNNYTQFYSFNGNNPPAAEGSVGPGTPLQDFAAKPTYAGPTSVAALFNDNTINIYPNPSNDIVFLKLESGTGNVNVIIADVMGRVVFSTTYTAPGERISVDVRAMAPGVYTLKVLEEGKVAKSARLMKR